MSHSTEPYAPAVQVAHRWLKAVADGLDTDDLAFANRALRAWLHTVRDRIGVAASAHLSAQLPEILRGVYYEGWVPAHVPVRHGLAGFVDQFARTAGIDPEEVGLVAGSITAVLSDLFSPGQMNRVFAVLPMRVYGVLCGARLDADEMSTAGVDGSDPGGDTLSALHERVRALGDAIAILAQGLEQLPTEGVDNARAAAAAQQAHRILLGEGLVPDIGVAARA
ncbi:DUF2267 domain-containing protein [Nocardia bovistercoris]|uniref:DUF2267 domain-containing protein n=1 Tax=Nocardia bovistercoris TaxID=2785916 RepID=A0A931IG21_9NOCA|nr:DUF2267 domain-containing protein [Nocardia bovistercoris]MBH0781062.1 DUF2267 domain-containing protein [Nocardia bovistercoris]